MASQPQPLLTCINCSNQLQQAWRSCPRCGVPAPNLGMSQFQTEIISGLAASSATTPRVGGNEDAPGKAVSSEGTVSNSDFQRAPAELEVGSVVAGRLQLIELLGKGGMGKVFRARHIHLQQEVAVKTMVPGIAQQPEAAERFMREARTCMKIRHKRVVAVLDLDRDPASGNFLLIMELCHGDPLHKYLWERGCLGYQEAVTIIDHVLDGLGEAHRIGVAHRDIKPSNILVNHGDDGVEAKVLDFGLVRAVSEAARYEIGGTMTAANVMVGTPVYMAPEQLSGARVDFRTDLFSTGIVLYELLAGRRPWIARDPVELARLIRYEPPPPLDPTGLPPWLLAVIEKALQKLPDDRFQTAAEFRQALQDGAAGKYRAGFGGSFSQLADGAKTRSSKEAAAGQVVLPNRPPPGGDSNRAAPEAEPTQPVAARPRGVDYGTVPTGAPQAGPRAPGSGGPWLQLACIGVILFASAFGLIQSYAQLGIGLAAGFLLLVLATLAKGNRHRSLLNALVLCGIVLTTAWLVGVRPGSLDFEPIRRLFGIDRGSSQPDGGALPGSLPSLAQNPGPATTPGPAAPKELLGFVGQFMTMHTLANKQRSIRFESRSDGTYDCVLWNDPQKPTVVATVRFEALDDGSLTLVCLRSLNIGQRMMVDSQARLVYGTDGATSLWFDEARSETALAEPFGLQYQVTEARNDGAFDSVERPPPAPPSRPQNGPRRHR